MATFLSVLKIIGIVLLVILVIAIVLLLLILFVPVRYRIDGEIKETNLETDKDKIKDNVRIKASFSWLLHIISGYFAYPEDEQFAVKVLCFKVFPPKNKKNGLSKKDNSDSDGKQDEKQKDDASETEKITEMEEGFSESFEKDSEKESVKDSEKDSENDLVESSVEEAFKEKVEDNSEEATENIAESSKAESDNSSQEISDNNTESEVSSNSNETSDEGAEKGNFFDVLKKIFNTIIKIIETPKNVFKKIKCTISRTYAKIDMVKNTLSNDIFKRAFDATKKQFIRVLKMVLPKKVRADILIGLEDPAQTADVFAVYGILYPLLAGKVYITPEFERQIIKGEVHIKGRITVFTVVWAAAVLFFNKDVKKTVRRFKRIINS